MPNSTSFIARNFWTTTFILFCILFVPLMLREWVSLRSEGLYNVEWHTSSMASLLERDLAIHHSLPEVLSDLHNPQTFDEFDQHVRPKLGYLGLLNLTIYDASGEVVYAVEKDLIGKIFLPGDGRKAALTGKIVSSLISRNEYFKEYSTESNLDLAEVHLPITAKDGEIPYVLEAYYDYSPIMQRTHILLIKSALSLLATTLVVMVILIHLYKSRQSMDRQVKALEAILPICMHCKKVRIKGEDQAEEWVDIETYVSRKDDLALSHGICADCLQKHYPDSKAARNAVAKT